MRLQDELVTLRLECTNLYRKGHFTSLELVPPSTLTTTHLKAEPLTKVTHSSSTSWFRKPMTRVELVSISSSEDEGNLRFVYELLSWVEEMQVGVHSKYLCSTLRFLELSNYLRGSGCSVSLVSVQFSRSVVSDSLRPHESQHARPPCPSPTPGVHSDSRPSSP